MCLYPYTNDPRESEPCEADWEDDEPDYDDPAGILRADRDAEVDAKTIRPVDVFLPITDDDTPF